MKFRPHFSQFARVVAHAVGKPIASLAALATIAIWAVLGPAFGFSDTWQLVINTGTTIVTFLMVFLIQNTQNRDTEALQLKLDALICAIAGANKTLLDLEELEDEEIERVRKHYAQVAQRAREGDETGDDRAPSSSA